MSINNSIQKIHDTASAISQGKWEKLKALKKSDIKFDAYENLLCIFQTFNKSHLLKMVLNPFVDARFKNIMLFADGCIDESVAEAQDLLTGKNHSIIVLNDLHEIHNYRFALTSEWGKKSEFALLMQDDDLYPTDFRWLDYGLEMMKKDPKLVVIGYRSGFLYEKICPASPTFETDPFYWEGNKMGAPGGSRTELIEGADIGAFGLNFKYCDIVVRAPHLIRVAEFLEHTEFDPLFEPFQDDDSNYCLQLWSKGYRVGLVGGARIARDVGIGGMRLSNHMTLHSRPAHTKRNHNYLYERYGSFINSGELAVRVKQANNSIEPKKLLYL
jgi:hypothetical protein